MIKRSYSHDFTLSLSKVHAAWTDADFLVAMMLDAGSRDIEVTVESAPEEIIVTIEDVSESKMARIELMKKAATDPLFLKDIEEIFSDFEFAFQ